MGEPYAKLSAEQALKPNWRSTGTGPARKLLGWVKSAEMVSAAPATPVKPGLRPMETREAPRRKVSFDGQVYDAIGLPVSTVQSILIRACVTNPAASFAKTPEVHGFRGSDFRRSHSRYP